ncbi:MAG: hypothetical protein ACYDA5_06985 [Vulcanimicrobiaceae bacterium]
MMHLRRLRAIVGARLYAQRRFIIFACALAFVVGVIQPHGIVATFDPHADNLSARAVWLAGPIFVGALLGTWIALAQRTEHPGVLDFSEQTAPLFGRELARAKAVVPCAIVTPALLAYWLGQGIGGFPPSLGYFAMGLVAAIAATLIALSGTLRQGARRAFYAVLALASAAIAYAIAVYAPPWVGVVGELCFAAIVAFIALRQYGEALARYDPL